MRLLVGDVGGTKTRLALFETDADELHKTGEGTYPSGEYSGLEAIAERFLESQGQPRCQRACFGIAGPVKQDISRTTNLYTITAPSNADPGVAHRHDRATHAHDHSNSDSHGHACVSDYARGHTRAIRGYGGHQGDRSGQ